MSNNLMDTEKGGEQTQYEGAHTFVESHAKEAGQLGGESTPSTATQHKSATNAPNTQGVTPADKIRYGQSIQEGGMGGQTAGMSGKATTEGGFGGTERLDEREEGFAKERRAQGYGGGRDASKDVGA